MIGSSANNYSITLVFFQCISHCVPPADYFCGAFEQDLNGASQSNGEVAAEFARILRTLASHRFKSLTPTALKRIIGTYNPTFRGSEQQDAHEFLRALISMLNDDINKGQQQAVVLPQLQFDQLEEEEQAEQAWARERVADNSAVRDAFFGQRRSTLTCLSCGKKSSTYAAFGELILQLPAGNNSCSLNDLISKELDPEEVDLNCSRCQRSVRASKTAKIVRLPQILIVQLVRFFWDARGNSGKKKNMVNYDISLKVPATGGDKNFKLVGVTTHQGETLASGHYIAQCYSSRLKRWVKFDDDLVSPVTPESVRSSQGSYILFYKMSDPAEPPRAQSISGPVSRQVTARTQPAESRQRASAPVPSTASSANRGVRTSTLAAPPAQVGQAIGENAGAGAPRRTPKRRSAMENAHCPTPAKAFSPPPQSGRTRTNSRTSSTSSVVSPPTPQPPQRGATRDTNTPTRTPQRRQETTATAPTSPVNAPLPCAQDPSPRAQSPSDSASGGWRSGTEIASASSDDDDYT